MTTTVDPALLQTLHHILRQKSELNDRIRRGPKQTAAAELAEKSVTQELQNAKDQLTRCRMAADEKQLQLKGREDKIEDLKLKRNACDSNKEFQLLTDQIAADEAANLVLSDEILELLEKIDVCESTVEQAQAKLTDVKKETARIVADVEAKLGVLENDMQLVEKELAESESMLPGQLRDEYKRLVAANGEDGLAKLDDNCCGNCYTILSPHTIDKLRMKVAVSCGSCGSILYLPQNDSVAS